MKFYNSIPKSKFNFWYRTSLGLEKIVVDELRSKFDIQNYQIEHRSVFVDIEDKQFVKKEIDNSVCHIRTADDVYIYAGFCSGVSHTKESLNVLLHYFKEIIIPFLAENQHIKYLRTTVSFLGKRNYNRYYVEEKLNYLISKKLKINVSSNLLKEPWQSNETRIRCHIDDDIVHIGISIKDTPLHRRTWRSLKYSGQLHPPVGAAMVRFLEPFSGQLIDPFCGSGTILIESSIINSQNTHLGFDISNKAIEIAQLSSIKAKQDITFSCREFSINNISTRQYQIITNPPWNNKHKISINQYDEFIDKLYKMITLSSKAILLIPELILQDITKKFLKIEIITQTRVRGKLTYIVKIY